MMNISGVIKLYYIYFSVYLRCYIEVAEGMLVDDLL
jgi:hypothetical protein